MKRALFLLVLCCPLSALGQTQQVSCTTHDHEFFFPSASLPQITRFELKYDTGAFTVPNVNNLSTPIPPTTNARDKPPAGSDSYRVDISCTLAPGPHTWTVRACNTVLCGPEVTPGMGFTVAATPPAPSGLSLPVK